MKVGIVGTGMIAQIVAPQLKSWGIELVAIASSSQSADKAQQLAQTLGASAWYSDYSQLIADPRVDTIYVAVPNYLHYIVAKAALNAHKDVICEKPLTANAKEATALAALALEKEQFLWEAVVTTRQPNFLLIREKLLPCLGEIRQVNANYSQYSSRYDAFCSGQLPPVFDSTKAGGALMDLGLYVLTFTLGLFGEPKSCHYMPHIERGIDTSGVITLTYDTFTAINVCSKDCDGPNACIIQGTEGYIYMDSAPTTCGKVILHLRDDVEKTYDYSLSSVYEAEFKEFLAQQEKKDYSACYQKLEESLLVSRVRDILRHDAGILFPSDNKA